MQMNDYQLLAARTIDRKNLDLIGMECHALHGMVSEIGELHGIYQKEYQGHGLDLTPREEGTGRPAVVCRRILHCTGLETVGCGTDEHRQAEGTIS